MVRLRHAGEFCSSLGARSDAGSQVFEDAEQKML